MAYDTNVGNLLATKDADAVAGISGHTDATDCTVSGTAYSACAQFDPTYDALPTRVTNALGQQTILAYTTGGTADATNGWGTWLTTTTDPNQQVTAYGYDALGRLTAVAQPGDTLSSTTTSDSYPVTCPTTGAAEPCTGLSATQRLSSTSTVTSATYYDGWGRPVETVTPLSSRNFGFSTSVTYSVQYTRYDPSGRVQFKSAPYFVSKAFPQMPAVPPYFPPDTSTTVKGASYTYDGLGRVLTTTDPIGNVTHTSYAEMQPQGANVNDTNVYAAVVTVDANNHKSIILSDGFGRVRYTETFLGNGSSVPYSLYGTTAMSYDYLGDVTTVTGPNPPPGAAGLSTTPQTTTTYDLMGRVQTSTDADLGTYTSTNANNSYDPDGNLLRTTDPRGTTVYAGYDGLDRQLWRNTTNSETGAYVKYTYDSTAGGNLGEGRLTQETFAGGTTADPLSGSYSYTYDGRGRVSTLTQTTTENASYALNMTYNDAGQPTSITFSDNEVFRLTYSAFDWLTSLNTTPSGGSAINLLTSISYSGAAGAAGQPTGASMPNGAYTFSASYDDDLRLLSTGVTPSGSSTPLYSSARTYDAVGNVATVNTRLAAGTDNQAFCYDEMDRLVWAGSTGTPSCNVSLTPGTLTAAYYSSTFGYDALDRFTHSSLGAYTYGDSAHLHAATAAGSNGQGGPYYTASYDVTGDMTCRAPNPNATCSGGNTGAQMTYDAERRLNHWQDVPGTSPGSQIDYLYDGEGHRVEQVVAGSSGTTKIYYLLGGSEEVSVGASTTMIKYYPSGSGGLPGTVNVGGTISYLATDGEDSLNEVLDGNGNVTAQRLYAPYGAVRYSGGTMPTAKGFTGQYADAATTLDYYNARYYDPAIGQFASADTVQGPNRYAYVGDNPETHTDPSGHIAGCLLDIAHSSGSGEGWLGTAGTCAGEIFQGVRAASQAKAVTTILDVAMTQYKTGNLKYLTQQGADELVNLTRPNALAGTSWSTLRNPLSAVGMGEEPASQFLQTVKNVISKPGNALDEGVGGGESHIGALEGALEDTGGVLGRLSGAAKALGVAGILLTGAVAGVSDYNTHHDARRAALVGATHAVLSGGGAWLGGAIGGALGALAGPGGLVVGSFIGASVGGWLGDQLAGGIVDWFDSGGLQGTETAFTDTLGDVGNAFSDIAGVFGF